MSKPDTRERALGCFASCILLLTPYDLLVSFGPKYPGGAPMGRGGGAPIWPPQARLAQVYAYRKTF